jgi:hypothetical protein
MTGFYERASRAQVVALRSYGVPAKVVQNITGVAERTQRKMIQKAKERGFDFGNPNGSLLLDIHVVDGERCGAPVKRTAVVEPEVLEKVRMDR